MKLGKAARAVYASTLPGSSIQRTASLLLLSFLTVGSAAAFTAGRDYVPDDFTVDQIELIGASTFSVLDVFGFAGDIWVGMMFTGGDDACTDNAWGVQLWQLHGQRGDQSGGSLWSWKTSVAADATTGIVIDGDRGNCGAETVMDPEIVKYDGAWLAFSNGAGGIHVAASAFPCSNFSDEEADGDTDWGPSGGGDAGCSSPWDTTE